MIKYPCCESLRFVTQINMTSRNNRDRIWYGGDKTSRQRLMQSYLMYFDTKSKYWISHNEINCILYSLAGPQGGGGWSHSICYMLYGFSVEFIIWDRRAFHFRREHLTSFLAWNKNSSYYFPPAHPGYIPSKECHTLLNNNINV